MNVPGILDAVVSHALSLGIFEVVNTFEPTTSPSKDLSAAIWVNDIEPVQSSGLNETSVRIELTVQIMTHTIQDPIDMIDPSLLEAVDTLLDTYSNDFTLDGLLREVDLLGSEGTPLRASFGYVDYDDNQYRVAIITLPLIVNDVWSQNG